jgi:DNA topoisomerase-1
MLQRGETESEEKPDFAPLLSHQMLESITFEEALHNFQLPRNLGAAKDGEDIIVSVGRYGPYIKHDTTFVSISEDDLFTITFEEALGKIKEKAEQQKNRIINEFPDVKIQVLNGQYGPYITDGKKNAKIPKDVDPKTLKKADCQKLLAEAPVRKFRRRKS